MAAKSKPNISFHRTREGLLAALTGELAFLALPSQQGSLRVAAACGLANRPSEWVVEDFVATGPVVEDEAAFRDRVSALARYEHDLDESQVRELPPGTATLWGEAQESTLCAEGVVLHVTASHGGYHLDAARNALVHPAYRNEGGWYEEDIEWAKVAVTFPGLFPLDLASADQALRDYQPEAYEAVNRVTLAPGESMKKDEPRFRLDHAPAPEHGQEREEDTPAPPDMPATAPEPRTRAQERAAMRRLDLPSYAAEKHGYALEWRDDNHAHANLRKNDELLEETRDKDGTWFYESRTLGGDDGDIIDFEIHRGAKSVAKARENIRPALERAEREHGRLDPQPTLGGAPEPDAPSHDQPSGPRPDPDDRPRRGRR